MSAQSMNPFQNPLRWNSRPSDRLARYQPAGRRVGSAHRLRSLAVFFYVSNQSGPGVLATGSHLVLAVGPLRFLHHLCRVLSCSAFQKHELALGDAHRREDRRRAIRAEDQVDFVGRDQLLMQRTRDVGLRLIVIEDVGHGSAKQAAGLVETIDVILAHDLVDEAALGEWPRVCQRLPDLDRRARRRLRGRRAASWSAGRLAKPAIAARRDQWRMGRALLPLSSAYRSMPTRPCFIDQSRPSFGTKSIPAAAVASAFWVAAIKAYNP